MKKIVIGTLLASLVAVAQAGVGVTGKISLWADSTEVRNTTTNSVATEPTSNFAFSAREKLGEGLTARARIETSLRGNTFGGDDTRIGDRQATVGVAGKLGSFDLGRNVHSTFIAITSNDSFGTLYGSVAGDVHNLRGLRFDNAMFVTARTPRGITLAYDREQNTGAHSVSVSGKVLGANLVGARFERGSEVSNVFAANTKIGATKLFASYSDDQGAVNRNGRLVGVSHDLNKWTWKASYGSTTDGVKAAALGADYSLSKRTEVGLALRNVERPAGDIQQVAVGITHRF